MSIFNRVFHLGFRTKYGNHHQVQFGLPIFLNNLQQMAKHLGPQYMVGQAQPIRKFSGFQHASRRQVIGPHRGFATPQGPGQPRVAPHHGFVAPHSPGFNQPPAQTLPGKPKGLPVLKYKKDGSYIHQDPADHIIGDVYYKVVDPNKLTDASLELFQRPSAGNKAFIAYNLKTRQPVRKNPNIPPKPPVAPPPASIHPQAGPQNLVPPTLAPESFVPLQSHQARDVEPDFSDTSSDSAVGTEIANGGDEPPVVYGPSPAAPQHDIDGQSGAPTDFQTSVLAPVIYDSVAEPAPQSGRAAPLAGPPLRYLGGSRSSHGTSFGESGSSISLDATHCQLPEGLETAVPLTDSQARRDVRTAQLLLDPSLFGANGGTSRGPATTSPLLDATLDPASPPSPESVTVSEGPYLSSPQGFAEDAAAELDAMAGSSRHRFF